MRARMGYCVAAPRAWFTATICTLLALLFALPAHAQDAIAIGDSTLEASTTPAIDARSSEDATSIDRSDALDRAAATARSALDAGRDDAGGADATSRADAASFAAAIASGHPARAGPAQARSRPSAGQLARVAFGLCSLVGDKFMSEFRLIAQKAGKISDRFYKRYRANSDFRSSCTLAHRNEPCLVERCQRIFRAGALHR